MEMVMEVGFVVVALALIAAFAWRKLEKSRVEANKRADMLAASLRAPAAKRIDWSQVEFQEV